RISEVDDFRAGTYGTRTYLFAYNGDSILHLTSITNYISSPEAYTFTYAPATGLYSPFEAVASGSTQLLQSLTVPPLNIPETFAYVSMYGGTTGELAQVTLPQGGTIRWDYRS